MLCPSDPGVGLKLVDHAVDPKMAARQNTGDSNRIADLAHFPGRKFSQHITRCGIHIRLVERDPESAQIAQTFHHVAREALEQGRRVGMQERALRLNPPRICEVVQAHAQAVYHAESAPPVARGNAQGPLHPIFLPPARPGSTQPTSEERSGQAPAQDRSHARSFPTSRMLLRNSRPIGSAPRLPSQSTGCCGCDLQPGRRRSKRPTESRWETRGTCRMHRYRKGAAGWGGPIILFSWAPGRTQSCCEHRTDAGANSLRARPL